MRFPRLTMPIARLLRIVRPTLLCLGLLALGWPVPSADGHRVRARFTPQELEPLLQSLQDEGLPRSMLNGVFYDERLRKTRSAVALNGVNQDSVDIYKQYTTRYAVRKAKRFKRRFFKILERATIFCSSISIATMVGSSSSTCVLSAMRVKIVPRSMPRSLENNATMPA